MANIPFNVARDLFQRIQIHLKELTFNRLVTDGGANDVDHCVKSILIISVPIHLVLEVLGTKIIVKEEMKIHISFQFA